MVEQVRIVDVKRSVIDTTFHFVIDSSYHSYRDYVTAVGAHAKEGVEGLARGGRRSQPL